MKITKIYTGRDRVCRCGCAGQYVTAEDGAIFHKRVRRFERMWATYTPLTADVDDTYRNISYGNDRAITAYFEEA